MKNDVNISSVTNLALLAQFVNFLEFVLINPLGPFITSDIGIAPSEVGWIFGAYAFSATISGILCASFIDSYDRKRILETCFAGMIVGTLLCVLSYDFNSLIVSRVIVGAFGGPATAITVAILSDFVTPKERGKAFGKVMGAFPLASIIGVPIALEITRLYSWQASYFIVLIFEILCLLLILKTLPNITSHIDENIKGRKFNKMICIFKNWNYNVGLSASFLTFFSFFLIIPNLANLLIYNYGLDGKYLSTFFFIGGCTTFTLIKIVGWACDKYSSTFATWVITSLFVLSIFISQVLPPYGHITIIFSLLMMVCISSRNTAVNVATSKIPSLKDRAGYLAVQNSLQNFGSALGGSISGAMLSVNNSKMLIGIAEVGILAMATALLVPLLVQKVENITNSYEQ